MNEYKHTIVAPRALVLGIGTGALAAVFLLVLYGVVVTLVSGSEMLREQWELYRYYLAALSAGFGVQVALYSILLSLLRERQHARAVLATTGTTSGVAMLACCAHYFATLLPVLGLAGFATALAQYQIQFFWVGLLANLGGIGFMSMKLRNAHKHL